MVERRIENFKRPLLCQSTDGLINTKLSGLVGYSEKGCGKDRHEKNYII